MRVPTQILFGLRLSMVSFQKLDCHTVTICRIIENNLDKVYNLRFPNIVCIHSDRSFAGEAIRKTTLLLVSPGHKVCAPKK